jgi:WD40 repeat protein/beta-lactamase regulating signal transducer with metallopeptidase domain
MGNGVIAMNSLSPSSLWGLLEPDFSLRLTLTLLHFLWQGCVLGLLGAAAGRCLRSASSRARYAVFVAILFLMGSTVCGTYWLTGGREESPPASPPMTAIPIADEAADAMQRLAPTGVPDAARNSSNAPRHSSEPTAEMPRLPSAPPTASAVTGRGIESYAPFVVMAYLVGALLMLVRLTFALWGGRRLRLSAMPIQAGPLAAAVSRQAARIGLKAVPIVAWCRRTSVPVVAGVFRPMILLPATLATGLDSAQLEALIAHELAHIRRYDPLINVLQRLIEATLFFHPAVWYISRRVSAERENACDDLVLLAGWPAARYAQALLEMAELCAAPRGIAKEGAILAATGGGSSQFKRRVLRLLEIDDAPSVRLSRGGALLLMATAVLLFTTPALIGPVTGKALQAIAAQSDSDATKDSTAAAGDKHDVYGDPLPAGALLRLGTVRLRHSHVAISVAFSPNGQTLATAAWRDSQIRLWDVRTGHLIRTFRGSSRNTARQMAFSPNGTKLAAVCSNGGVQLWDVASGLELRETDYAQPQDGARAVAFAPDGKSFATSGAQGDVRLWDADSSGRERLVMDLGRRSGGPHPLAFSPDGKLLACATTRDIHLFDLHRGVEAATIRNPQGQENTRRLEFGPEGKMLFSAAESVVMLRDAQQVWPETSPRLRMWDVAGRKLIREFVDPALELGGCTLALSRDGRTLVSLQLNTVLLWDVVTGKVTQRIPRGGLASLAADKPIDVVEVDAAAGVAISPDGMTVATADNPLHSVTLWDVATGRRKPDFPAAHSGSVEELACSSDGAHIATGGGDGIVHLWELASGKHLNALVLGDPLSPVRSVAFARDGQTLAAGGQDRKGRQDSGLVRIWDAKSGEQRLEVRTGQDVSAVALSNDGSKLALATSRFSELRLPVSKRIGEVEQQRSLLFIDAKTGAERQRIKLEGYVRTLAFSPTGEMVFSAEHPGTLSTWDVATGKLVRKCDVCDNEASRQSSLIFSAAFSVDASLAVVKCFPSNSATLWDLAKGKQIGHLNSENETDLASVVAISPDNRVIASASWGGEDTSPEKHLLRLWDARTGKLLNRSSHPLSNRVASLAFTPDGQRLISGMSDGSSLIWDVSGL